MLAHMAFNTVAVLSVLGFAHWQGEAGAHLGLFPTLGLSLLLLGVSARLARAPAPAAVRA
jgi:hypothetical protein